MPAYKKNVAPTHISWFIQTGGLYPCKYPYFLRCTRERSCPRYAPRRTLNVLLVFATHIYTASTHERHTVLTLTFATPSKIPNYDTKYAFLFKLKHSCCHIDPASVFNLLAMPTIVAGVHYELQILRARSTHYE